MTVMMMSSSALLLSTRRRSRKRRQIQQKDRQRACCVDIPFLIPDSFRSRFCKRSIVAACTKSMISHLSYMRGVLPSPPSVLLQAPNESDSTRRDAKMRRAAKCRESLMALWRDLDGIFGSRYGEGIEAVLITLGTSWQRPRENFLINAKHLGNDKTDTIHSQMTARDEHTLSRRLIAQFMTGTQQGENERFTDCISHTSAGASSFKVFVSVCISSHILGCISGDDNQDSIDLDSDQSWSRLHFRRDFKLQSLVDNVGKGADPGN